MKKALKISFLVFLVSAVGFGCSTRNTNYPYYGNGGNSAVLAGAVGGGLLALGVASGYGSYQQGETQRYAIAESGRNERERIRAQTALGGPCALGGSGDSSYESEEGKASIKANVSGIPPCANASIPSGATPYHAAPQQVTAGQGRSGRDDPSGCGGYRDPDYCAMYRRGQAPPHH